MPKFDVIARTIVFKKVGTFEAENKEEAIQKAYEEGDIELTLCHHCHKDVGEIELDMLIAEEE